MRLLRQQQMGKRRHNEEETAEQRKERKRLKKEQKKNKKDAKDHEQQRTTRVESSPHKSSEHTNEKSDAFFRKKLELTISLLPTALTNVLAHAEDALRLYLLKYSDGIGGILLAFEHLKIISENKNAVSGIILNELPHIHYRVSTDALVFNPTPGSKLSGTVTESSFHSHLSLVVHKYFNASISSQMLRNAGFEFDTIQLQWYYQRDANATALKQDDNIDFICHKLYESGGIISMEGSEPVFVSKT
jgi:DNA-directed RNA polymerase subunit E'/Rpb7